MPERTLSVSPVIERWRRWDMGSRQRAGRFWRDHADRDPTFQQVVMGVELFFGSDRVVRVARAPLATTSALDGRERMFLPGLMDEPELDHTTGLGQQTAGARALTFQIPGFLVKPSDILSSGRILAGLGEVSLYVDGMDYDLRLVLMRGDVSGGVQFGHENEYIDIQLSDPRETQSQHVPNLVVKSSTWANANVQAIGQRYPLVVNAFNRIPCLRVIDNWPTSLKFLIASPGHEFTVDAAFLNDASITPSTGTYRWVEEKTTDSDGNRVLLLDMTTSTANLEDSDQISVDVSLSSGSLKSTIQIIEDLLKGYTSLGMSGLNPDLFSRAQADMAGTAPEFMANGSGKETARAQDLIESGLLDSFPMVNMVYEGRGLGPIVYDRRIGPARARIDGVFEADKFPLIERETLYEETPKSELFNEFQIRYAYNALKDTYTKTLVRDFRTSAACALSVDWVGGVRPFDVLESPYIRDDALGGYVIDWLVTHYAIPSYYVEWSCLPWVFTRYRRGMNVLYSDAVDVAAFSSTPATIEKIALSRGKCVIGFRVWHPAWDGDLSGLVGG